jgi:outer membrane protein TolC
LDISAIEEKEYSLKDLISNAISSDFSLKEQDLLFLSLDVLRNKIESEVSWYISSSLIVAPIYEVKGNIYDYEKDYGRWGPLLISSFEVGVPIFFWGVDDVVNKAYNSGKKAIHYKKITKANEVIYKVKELYFSYLGLLDIKDELLDISEGLRKLVKKAEARYINGDISQGEFLKIKLYSNKVMSGIEDVNFLIKKVLCGISYITGISVDRLKIKREEIREPEISLKKLSYYLSLMKRSRAEFKALKYMKKSIFYMKEVAKINRYPIFFVGLKGDFSYTDMREDFHNPYVNDDYNYSNVGIGIGVKWRFSLAKNKYLDSEVKVKERENLLMIDKAFRGLAISLRLAYYKLLKDLKKVEIAKNSYRIARRWLISAKADYDANLIKSKELIEAYKGYFEAKKEFIMAIVEAHKSYANLLYNIGENIKIGKVVK